MDAFKGKKIDGYDIDNKKSVLMILFSRINHFFTHHFQLYSWCFFCLLYILLLSVFWGNVIAAAAMSLMVVPAYGVISIFLRICYSYFDVTSDFKAKQFLLLVVLNSICGFIQLLFTEILIDFFVSRGVEFSGDSRLWIRYIFHCLVFGIWSVAYLWLKAEACRTHEAEERRKALEIAERAELQMLRYQLNPHFLFNCLNGIITEIQERPMLAVDMTHRLALYMRQSLEYRNDLLVSLDHEIDGVKMYLQIEQDRFNDHLKVFFDVPIDCSKIMVPVYLLQPIIENSIKHGMRSSEPPWEIRVEIEIREKEVQVKIKNSGTFNQEMLSNNDEGNVSSGTGVGLDVLKRRLMMHYPERHQFNLRQEGRFTVAEITLVGEPC